MQALTVTNDNAIIQAQDITADLMQNFINWIDRSDNTTRAYIINLRQFITWLKLNGIDRPTRQDIISYRDYLTAKGHKPNTVNVYLRSVKQFFAWTAASGNYPNIAANIHTLKVNNSVHKKDALTASEVVTIEESIQTTAANRQAAAMTADKDTAGKLQRSTEQGKRIYAMYLLAVTCGLRTIEIHRANVKDIETKAGQSYIYIWGKGHNEADTKKPLAAEVAEAIKDYLQSRTDNYNSTSPLFVSTGNRAAGKRIATTTISTMLKGAMKQAGFNSERITAHSLRHTAGTAYQELTGDIYQTQQYMRHANPATTEIYLHNKTEQQEAKNVQRLYKYYHGETETGESLEELISLMTPDQVKQLTSIAAAILSRQG